MKDFRHIDELIRQKFEGFEPVPPESVWEKVREGIKPDTAPPRGGNISLPIITGLIVLLGLVSLLWLINRMETTIPLQTNDTPALSDEISQFMAPAEDHLVANAYYLSQEQDAALDLNGQSERILTSSNIPVRKPFEGYVYQNDVHDVKDAVRTAAVSPAKPDQKQLHSRFSDEPGRMKGKGFNGTLGTWQGSITASTRGSWDRMSSDDYVAPARPQWSVGVYLNPDVTFYPADDITNTINYGFQILPRLTFNHLYLQSGIGVRTGGDRGDYRVNYNKYLGSYEHVYEVTFDTAGNTVVPTYHTETVDVYDTVPYYSISETKVSYAYLDVPLLIGRQWSFDRLSLYVHAGPSVSLLLGRSSPQADYPDEQIRILHESQQIPTRQQINWQIMAGAGFSYSIGDMFSLSLEPTFRYYMTKDFDNDQLNTRHPYSFGIRAGFVYHINH